MDDPDPMGYAGLQMFEDFVLGWKFCTGDDATLFYLLVSPEYSGECFTSGEF